MKCHEHPKRNAVSSCTMCGKGACARCLVVIEGKNYCKTCVEQTLAPIEHEKDIGINADLIDDKKLRDHFNQQCYVYGKVEQIDANGNKQKVWAPIEYCSKTHLFQDYT